MDARYFVVIIDTYGHISSIYELPTASQAKDFHVRNQSIYAFKVDKDGMTEI